MARGKYVKIEGLQAVLEMFDDMADIADDDNVLRAFGVEAGVLAGEVRRRIPVKSGLLLSAVKEKVYRDKGVIKAFVAMDSKVAPYAGLVEFGHGGKSPAPAHPYFRPAYDNFKNRFGYIVKSAIERKAIAIAK